MVRILDTLEDCDFMSSTNSSGLDPPVVGKSLLEKLMVPPHDVVIAGNDGSVTCSDGGFLKVGAGEGQQQIPEGGPRVATTSPRSDLQ